MGTPGGQDPNRLKGALWSSGLSSGVLSRHRDPRARDGTTPAGTPSPSSEPLPTSTDTVVRLRGRTSSLVTSQRPFSRAVDWDPWCRRGQCLYLFYKGPVWRSSPEHKGPSSRGRNISFTLPSDSILHVPREVLLYNSPGPVEVTRVVDDTGPVPTSTDWVRPGLALPGGRRGVRGPGVPGGLRGRGTHDQGRGRSPRDHVQGSTRLFQHREPGASLDSGETGPALPSHTCPEGAYREIPSRKGLLQYTALSQENTL